MRCLSGRSRLPELSDHEKGVKLEQCNRHLAALDAGENPESSRCCQALGGSEGAKRWRLVLEIYKKY